MNNRKNQIKAAIQRTTGRQMVIYTNHPEALEKGEILTPEQAAQHPTPTIRIGFKGDAQNEDLKPVLLNAKEFKIKYFYHEQTENNSSGDAGNR